MSNVTRKKRQMALSKTQNNLAKEKKTILYCYDKKELNRVPSVLSGNYVEFPNAQGSVTLRDTTINGDFSISQTGINKINFTNQQIDDSLIIGNTNYSSTNTTNSVFIGTSDFVKNDKTRLNNSIIIGNDSLNGYGTNGIVNETVAIGKEVLKNLNLNHSNNKEHYPVGTTCVGNYSLGNLVDSSNTISELNTALGYNSGNKESHQLLNGLSNTFLGANTGVDNSGQFYTHSTAVGAGSVIKDNNQIVLGTNSDHVYIPNYLKFSDGTTLSSMNFNNANNQQISILYLTSNYTLENSNPNSEVKIFNKGNMKITITSNNNIFKGNYGNYLNTIELPQNNYYKFYYNGTNWEINERSSNIYFSIFGGGNTFDWSSNFQYLDSEVEFVDADSSLNNNYLTGIIKDITSDKITSNITKADLEITNGTVTVGTIITTTTGIKYVIQSQQTGLPGSTGNYTVKMFGYEAENVTIVNKNTNFSGKGWTGLVKKDDCKILSPRYYGNIHPPTTIPIMPVLCVKTQNELNTGSTLSISNEFFYVVDKYYYETENDGRIYLQNYLQTQNPNYSYFYFITGELNNEMIQSYDYYVTYGTNVILPDPKKCINKRITINNSSENCICLNSEYNIIGKNAFIDITKYLCEMKTYLLNPKNKIILFNDGNNWKIQEGTTYFGNVTYSGKENTIDIYEIDYDVNGYIDTRLLSLELYPKQFTNSNMYKLNLFTRSITPGSIQPYVDNYFIKNYNETPIFIKYTLQVYKYSSTLDTVRNYKDSGLNLGRIIYPSKSKQHLGILDTESIKKGPINFTEIITLNPRDYIKFLVNTNPNNNYNQSDFVDNSTLHIDLKYTLNIELVN